MLGTHETYDLQQSTDAMRTHNSIWSSHTVVCKFVQDGLFLGHLPMFFDESALVLHSQRCCVIVLLHCI